MTILFQSGYETENDTFTVEWDGKYELFGTMTVVTVPVHHGSKSAQAKANSYSTPKRLYHWKNLGTPQDVYFYLGGRVSLLPDMGAVVRIMALRAGSLPASPQACYLEVCNDDGTPRFCFQWYDDSGVHKEVISSPLPETNKWFNLEMHYKKHGTEGVVELWINDTLKVQHTSLNTTENPYYARAGNGYGTWDNMIHAVWTDCVVVADEYVTPEPPAKIIKLHLPLTRILTRPRGWATLLRDSAKIGIRRPHVPFKVQREAQGVVE